jgi:hypothetical protein
MQVKEAVNKASKYLPEVFETAADKELRLEGVEKTEDGRFWKVTFSYSPFPLVDDLGNLIRDYKTVKLRDDNGEFIGAQNGQLLGEL